MGTQSPIQATVGFLGVSLENPTASLALDVAFDTVVNEVSLAQLSANDLSTAVTITPNTDVGANKFELTLPIQSTLNGLTLSTANIKVDKPNLFGTAPAPAPEIQVNTAELSEFRTVSVDGFFNALQQLQSTFGAISTFDAEIPFTGGQRLSDVLNIGDAFGAKIVSASADPANQTELIAAFKNAQEFADKVAKRITYVRAKTTAPTSPAELLFDVSFDHLFNVATFPIDFGAGIGPLSVQADSTLKVDAALAAALEIGIKLEQPGASFGFGDGTELSTLNGGKGVPTEAGKTDLRITLSNGKTKDLDLSSVTTIAELITALESGVDFATDLEVEFDEQRNLITGSTYNQGLILIDKSTSVNGGKLKFEMLNGSLAGPTLGLFGTGVNGIKLGSDNRPDESIHGMRTGPLHGETLANKVFVRPKSGEPMFSASASLSSDINGAAKLGFVEIDIKDGSALGSLKAEFTPSNDKTYGRFTGLASEPVPLGQATTQTGNVTVELMLANNTTQTINVQFSVEQADTITNVVTEMNAGLSTTDAALINVDSVAGKLVFVRKDGVNKQMTVKSNDDSKKLGITDDLTNNRIDGAEVVELASAAKLRLQAQKPVKFSEAYAGDLLIEITKHDGEKSDITLGFNIAANSTSADLGAFVLGLNAQLIVLGATNPDANLVRVVSSGGKLNFFSIDGIGRYVTIKAKTAGDVAKVAKLGITADLTGYLATPKISGSAQFELPFDVSLNFGAFTLPALSRTLSFDVPDLTVSDFSLPDNFNLDDLGLGGAGDVLNQLKSLNRDTIIQALKDGLDLLRKSVAESSLFNQKLPLLDVNVSEILDFTDTFAEIISNMNGTTASGIGQLDEVFEDVFGVAENNGGPNDYPAFAVSIIPQLNTLLVFDGVKLDSITDFPAAGKTWPPANPAYPDRVPKLHTNLISYLGALQSDNRSFGLSVDDTADDVALRIDLPFDIGDGFGVRNQVAPLGFQVPINVDLADLGVSALSSFIDARGDAIVSAYALGQVTLSVGITLPESGAPKPFMYDGISNGTSLGVLVKAAASPFNFDLSFGPIGASLTDGDLRLGSGPISGARFDPANAVNLTDNSIAYTNHGFITGDRVEYSSQGGVSIGGLVDGTSYFVIRTDANTIKLATTEANATAGTAIDLTSAVNGTQMHRLLGSLRIAVGIANDNGDGRHYFDEIVETVQNGLDLDDFVFAGSLDASLTAQLGFPGLPLGPYTFDASVRGSNLTDLLGSVDIQIYQGTPANPFSFDDVKNALAGDFNILALVGGWDGAFDLLIDAMEGEVFGVELPFIGDKLKDQANFLREIKDSVSANFSDNADNQESGEFTNLYDDVRRDLLDAIGPNGINLLKDLTGDNQVTIDDIVIEQLNPGIGFQILLGNDLGQLELPIDFDLGIPGLNLDVDANVTGTLGFELGFSFGVDLDNGFFIDTTDSFLNVFVDVGVPGLSASGELGFLRLDAAEVFSPAVAVIGKDDATKRSQLKLTSTAMGGNANFDVKFVQSTGTPSAAFDSVNRTLTLTVNNAVTTANALVALINNSPTASSHLVASKLGDGTGLVSTSQKVIGTSKSSAVAMVGSDTPNNNSQFELYANSSGSTGNFDVRVVQKAANDTADYVVDAQKRLLTLRVTSASTANTIVNLVNTDPNLKKLFTAVAVGNGTGQVISGQRAVAVANSFAGRFTVDILDPGQNDGLLTLSEILTVKSYKDILKIDATANAALDLHLVASFGGSNSFPSLQTDLAIDWEYMLGDSLQLPNVEFTDIELDLGQFFSGFAGTVLDEVNNILEPVRPIIKFLTQPVPVVSDLAGGDITMLDLLKLQGGSIAKAASFIQSVADFDKILQSIPDFGNGKLLNMGGAIFDPETRTFAATRNRCRRG